MGKVEAHVKDWKKEKVAELTDLIKKNPVIGILNLEELPSSQFQTIRGKLRGDIKIITAKKSLISRAFQNTKNEDMIEWLKGSPALLLTKSNPFKVFRIIKKNKSLSPIKPGQVAPYDLIAEPGETPFAPGPIIGELGQLGIKAKIVAGKINIMKKAVVVKQGESASDLAASILLKLGFKPIEVGLNLVAIKEEDIIYTPELLDIDYESKLMTAYVHARNLVLNTGLIVKDLIKDILAKAHFNALMLNGVINFDS
jgi:large subunit ribosomal protein L10